MSKFIAWVTKYNKTIAGFLVTGLMYWLKVKHNGVTGEEWMEILGSALSGGGLVWLVPNNKPKVEDDRNKV